MSENGEPPGPVCATIEALGRSDAMATYYRHLRTAFGDVMLTSNGRALTGLYFDGQKHHPGVRDDWRADDDAAPFAQAARELDAYARGTLDRFGVPVEPHGTPFQRRVWQALLDVPCGQTISYAQLAARVGAPTAVRAVGAAVGRNPVSVIVPCHRIVGADGSLTGYAGGLDRKRALLGRERALPLARGLPARRAGEARA